MGSGNSKTKPSESQSTGENDLLAVPFSYSRDHVQAMLDSFARFKSRRQYCDMHFHVKDPASNQEKVYDLHRFIFAASSEYCREKLHTIHTAGFKAQKNDQKILKPSESGSHRCHSCNPISVTSDFPVPEGVMNQVIEFLYNATVHVKIREIPGLFEAAHRLKIPTLQKYCEWALQNRYVLDLFQPIMKLSEKLDSPEIREFALHRTLERFDEFLDTKDFLQLSDKEMQFLVDNRRAFISNEVVIPEVEMFNAILKWEKHNHRKRQEKARSLLRHLHYQKLPKATLSGYVVTHDLVKGDKQLMDHIEEVLSGDKKRVLQRLRKRNEMGDSDAVGGVAAGSGDCVSYLTEPTLLACGGRLFDQLSAQVVMLNEKQTIWEEVTRMPYVLSHHCAVVVGNALYIAGGEDTTIPGTHSIPHFWRYDPLPKDVWTTLPDMLHSRSFFILASFGDNLYAFGGKSGKIVRNSAERYNSTSKRWEFCASLKTPRHAHAGCSFKNMFYVSGGIVAKCSSLEMIKMNPVTNHWTTLSPMRCPRSRHGMSSIRDRIYVIGGEDDTMGLSKSSSIAIECYTPECDQWFSVAHKMPFQSDGEYGCIGYDGCIFLVGGCKSQLADHRSEVWSYDPDEDKWKAKTKLPRRLRGAACAVMNMRQIN